MCDTVSRQSKAVCVPARKCYPCTARRACNTVLYLLLLPCCSTALNVYNIWAFKKKAQERGGEGGESAGVRLGQGFIRKSFVGARFARFPFAFSLFHET